MPMNMPAKPEPGAVTNGELKPVAMPFASIVLPVPGAPRKSSPRSGLPPAFLNSSLACQRLITRVISSLASACPRTSSSLTPQLASPGSYALICRIAISRNGPIRMPTFANISTTIVIAVVGVSACFAFPQNQCQVTPGIRSTPALPYSTTWKTQTRANTRSTEKRRRYFPRQYQDRRRATTSSCRSAVSAPNRFGQGITWRAMTSTRPRNAAIASSVPSAAIHQRAWCWLYIQRNTAGAVRHATKVAARFSPRHCVASAWPTGDPCGPNWTP